MKEILYIKGDATEPIGEGLKVIVHCCNTEGHWGAGFVLALSRKWRQPERSYRNWPDNDQLGNVQFVQVEDDIVVANMIGQEGVGYTNNRPPIRYEAIDKGLEKVYEYCKKYDASVHAPKFGAGLAGGKWIQIESLIVNNLCNENIPVTIYLF